MPLPKPNTGEERDDFLSRCMENETMRSEYPDEKQRYAVCNAQLASVVSASRAVAAKVIERRENGSGIVEVPLLPQTEIDVSRTARGGDGALSVDDAVLTQIVANFDRYPGPVPIGVHPHVDYGERAGFSPGFVNSVFVRDEVLFGHLDLGPRLFAEVVEGGWRGFSVEIARDLVMPTATLSGWTLTGGVLTNRPATDVHFQIAASSKETAGETAVYSSRLRAGKEVAMSEDRVAALEAEVSTQKELVENLRTRAESSANEFKTLEAKLAETKKDLGAKGVELSGVKAELAAAKDDNEHLRKQLAKEQQTRREVEVRLEAEEARTLREKVTEIAKMAIDRGVSAKHFEGLEEDPGKWFSARFVSLDAMGKFLDALPTVNESATSSGKKPDGEPTVSREHATRLRRMGLDPKYARISTEDQLLEVREREEKK